MKEMGINPVDPTVDFFPTKKKVWIPPDDPRFMFPPRPEDDPDWKPTKVYSCDNSVKLWEGLRQAQLLTNTLVQHQLPADILARSAELAHPDQDHMMQRIIMQANLWDTSREKLPRRKKPEDISVWNYKAEYGIPQSRIVDVLLRSMIQKCNQLLALKEADSVFSRYLIERHRLHTQYTFDNLPIHLTSRSNYLLTSTKPLERFASVNEVKETAGSHINNIFPVSSLVDLVKTNIYKSENCVGYLSDFKYKHHHTLFLEYDTDWTMDIRHANAILMSYAHCLEMARMQHAETTLINNPICVQTIHTDGISFGYTCFQLNTTISNTQAEELGYSTRRNIAWVDDDLLFAKNIPRRSMLRDTTYTNYNPHVMQKVLGMIGRQ
ncbi:MRPL37 [Bugula neritina]|uniref:Large ribosomal subunit protein mL37 n=1 Tax=Bugula neritina TaxID=10212 RepID=A0A7J7JGJ8_BUGNE|nr:MRPL37 [Bugula neritina]